MGSAQGVLGRLLDQLSAQPASFKGGAYSIAGNPKMTEGEVYAPDIISASNGAVRFQPELTGDGYNAAYPPAVRQLLASKSSSMYGETITALHEAVEWIQKTHSLRRLYAAWRKWKTPPPRR